MEESTILLILVGILLFGLVTSIFSRPTQPQVIVVQSTIEPEARGGGCLGLILIGIIAVVLLSSIA
jgi:hypothetical protein